jgi:hypothetical protein
MRAVVGFFCDESYKQPGRVTAETRKTISFPGVCNVEKEKALYPVSNAQRIHPQKKIRTIV